MDSSTMLSLGAGVAGAGGATAREPVEVGLASGQGGVTILAPPMAAGLAQVRLKNFVCAIYTTV